MSAFDRAMILFGQNRHDLAEGELRRALADEPNDPLSHAFLALCLAESKRFDEAAAEAADAIRLAPGLPFAHYAMARVLLDRGRAKEAEAAIGEAIRLDPEDADYFALRAAAQYNRRNWRDTLASAEEGLAVDAEHVPCNNLRAMALIKLGRKDEAGATIATALARDPENSVTHANQGWALLEQGDRTRALEHFREALRLDPGSEWARMGIVEALKAKHLVYRLMLRFFLWMSRLSGRAQWAVLLGLVFGRRALASVAESYPRLAPLIGPLLFLLFVFVVMTWIADPLFNLLLRLNRFGRLALSREQVVASNWLGACLLASLGSLAGFLVAVWAHLPRPVLEDLGIAAIDFGFLVLPVAGTFKCPAGWPRRVMGALTILLAVAGPGVALFDLLPVAASVKDRAWQELHHNYYLGVMLSTWASVLLSQTRTYR